MKILLGLLGVVAVIVIAGYFVLRRADIPYDTLAQTYANEASQYVDLPGGVRMHFRDEGAHDAPAILLIHGFSASLQTWEPWVEQLATGPNRPNDYRVISIDLPGHGLTQAPADFTPTIANFRDVVAAFVASQQLTRFALAGNSMGGNIAWEYALAHPDQVEALILVDSSGWPLQQNDDGEPLVFKLLRTPVIGPLLRDLDNTALIRSGVEAAFYNPALVDDAMVARYVDLSRAPGHRDILLQIASGRTGRDVATAERLAALQMPVLIIHGDTDRLVPPGDAELFHQAIPGSRLLMMEHIGHVPQEEAAEQSAFAVHEFLYEQYAQVEAIAAE